MVKIKTRDKLLDSGYIEIYKHGFQDTSCKEIMPKGMILMSKV